MRLYVAFVAGLAIAVATCSFAGADEKKGEKKVPAVLNFTMKGIDGKDVELAKYKGKVILLVNVASKCGYTPQYEDLQALHDKYAEKGLVVLGVPANDFGKQEPGTNEEIAKFCESKYKVKFDLLAKTTVLGKDQCDLYKFLTSKETNPKFAGAIEWNFTKFLIGRDGEVVNRFDSKTKPSSDKVTKAIETELEKK